MGEPLSMGEPVSISEPVWHPAPERVALVVVSLWLGVFLVAPVLTMVGGFVAPSDISRVLALPSTWRLVWFSLWQSAISVAVTLLVAAPVTWLIGLHRFRGRRILRATTTVGFLLPSVVVATAFLAILPRSLHYTMFAVVIAHAYFNIAVVVRVVGARLELLDIQLINAARTLGASPITVWRTIVWPLIRGAVAAAAAVIFLYCFTSFAVVRVLGGPRRSTLESDIALRAFGIGDIPAATVLALVQLVIVVSVIGVIRQLSGREQGLSRLAALPPTAVAHRQRLFACCVAIATATFVLYQLLHCCGDLCRWATHCRWRPGARCTTRLWLRQYGLRRAPHCWRVCWVWHWQYSPLWPSCGWAQLDASLTCSRSWPSPCHR